MDLVEVATDVITLIVEDQTQDIQRRVILEGPEVARLIDEDAELAHPLPRKCN
jgi:hypothetical protein